MVQRGVWILLWAAAAAACTEAGAERQIREVRDYVPVPRREIRPVDSFSRFGVPRPAPPPTGYEWDTPPGWQDLPRNPLRTANFRVGGDPDAECYLSELRGGAGRLAENINRWRRQMGLEPISAAEVEALPRVELLGQPAILVELDGTFEGMGGGTGQPGYRLVGLILDRGDDALALKMVGPAAVLERERHGFDHLRASLRVLERAAAGGEASGSGLGLRWVAPESWVKGGPRPMREVTYHPDNHAEAECVVYVFARPAGGDELGNLERWAAQMGEQLPPGGPAALAEIPILGQEARLLELAGTYTAMASAPKPDYAMLAVFCGLPTHVVCVKMTGPAEVLRAERQRFLDFCASLTTS